MAPSISAFVVSLGLISAVSGVTYHLISEPRAFSSDHSCLFSCIVQEMDNSYLDRAPIVEWSSESDIYTETYQYTGVGVPYQYIGLGEAYWYREKNIYYRGPATYKCRTESECVESLSEVCRNVSYEVCRDVSYEVCRNVSSYEVCGNNTSEMCRNNSSEVHVNCSHEVRVNCSHEVREICLRESVCSYSYDCSFRQYPCNLEAHRGKYRCQVYLKDHKETGLTTVLYYGSPGNREALVPCFIADAMGISASATSQQDATVLVKWGTTILPSRNLTVCNASFHIQIIGYQRYRDYLADPNHSFYFLDFEPIGEATSFDLALEDASLYYVFKVRNDAHGKELTFKDSDGPTVVTSPVFYFGQQEKASIVFPAQNLQRIVVSDGDLVELRCEGKGAPSPEVTLIQPTGARVDDSESSDPLVILKSIVATTVTAGSYHCTASNTYVRSQGGIEPSFVFKTIILEVRAVPVTGNLICSPIGGTLCDPYIFGSAVLYNTTIFTTTSNEVNGIILSLNNHKFNSRQRNSSLEDLFSKCVDLAKAMVCHSRFPSCQTNPLISRQICKSTCDMFRSGGVCENAIDSLVLPDLMMSESCDTRIDPAGSSPECIHVPFEDVPIDGSWCGRGNGQDYSGSTITTESGRVCQNWFSQSPHRHPAYTVRELYIAGRDCRNPGGRGIKPWCYTSDGSRRWEYCNVPQCSVCESYTGAFCSELPGYREQESVFMNRHESQWGEQGQSLADTFMFATFHKLTQSKDATIPVGCELHLKEILCHNTLPLCSSQGSLKTCSGHCKLMELLQVCPNDMLANLKREIDFNTRDLLEPDCDVSEEDEMCIAVQPRLSANVNSGKDYESCYNSTDNGLTFTGEVMETVSGQTCQSWGDDWSEAEENYCRNIGGVGSKPWCFTNREMSEWEYCDIPVCTEDPTIDGLGITSLTSTTVGIICFFVIFGSFLVGMAILVALIICYVYKRKEAMVDAENLQLEKLRNKQKWDYVINETYVKVTSAPEKIKKAIESFPQIGKSTIAYKHQIGQGNFGVVFYAKAEGLIDNEKETEVAVKTLKDDTSEEAMDDFVREAKLMFSFDHPNIVKIFGVCMEDMPYYLIFEYMDKGDLTQFLRSSASSLQRHLMNPFDERPRSRTESTLSDEPPSLSVEQLTDMCKQIAGGMNYLAEKNHVHRDLACRNCLVKSCDWTQTDSGLVIKIGDFGMSQNLYSSDYYRVRGQAVLPVRWMSPEAVIYGKFSTESDVWSFGVVMWEVFSFAMQPYYGTSNEEVTEAIRRHKVLSRPSYSPNSHYDIMKMCWIQDPHSRPTFDELYCLLSNCRLSVSSSERSDSQSIDYCGDNDGSDLDSDAFLEENSVKELDAAVVV